MTTSFALNSNIFKLKDYCQVGDGAHASIARQAAGVMYLSSKNFKPGGLDLSVVDFISENDFEKHFGQRKKALTTPMQGDVLFGIIGSLGTPYIVKRKDRFGLSSSVAILRANQQLCPKYLYYFMTSSAFQTAIHGMKSGSAQGFLSLEMIKNLPLFMHKIKVQRKIAAILSAYDDLIENNQRRLALLEKMAEELYREWFVRLRFPGYKQAGVEKGLPTGWTLVKVADAFTFTGGGTPSKEVTRFWQDGTVNWYTPSDITSGKSIFMAESHDKCTEEAVNSSSTKMFPAYSVMMTSRATIGAIGINLMPACTNQGFIVCIPNEHYPLTYLYHWLKLTKPFFEMLSGGATFLELNKGTFKKIEILAPAKQILAAFDNLVAPLFKTIEKLTVANQNLEKTRDMILPRLISGKLPVDALDIHFPPSMQDPAPDQTDQPI